MDIISQWSTAGQVIPTKNGFVILRISKMVKKDFYIWEPDPTFFYHFLYEKGP